jgi:hypothetical protein
MGYPCLALYILCSLYANMDQVPYYHEFTIETENCGNVVKMCVPEDDKIAEFRLSIQRLSLKQGGNYIQLTLFHQIKIKHTYKCVIEAKLESLQIFTTG